MHLGFGVLHFCWIKLGRNHSQSVVKQWPGAYMHYDLK